MNERIQKLRRQTLQTKPYISPERAWLETEFYKTGTAEKVTIPVARALCFKYILEHKEIYIGEQELIVGERGPRPKATPTYPEICTHTLKDLQMLNDREKINFGVDEETQRLTKDVFLPYWQGRSIRDRIFNEMDEQWKMAYESGIFTEFMEQRSPGHTVLDNKIYNKGMIDFREDISKAVAGLDFMNDPRALAKREELKAMDIAAEAIILFAQRYAAKALELSENEKDARRKSELEQIAAVCKHVPEHAPRTLDSLRKAQTHPERYRDLIVRVAGYSDYFVDLGIDLQNEIIRRTENAAV